jgi:hypothetical protein
MLEIEILKTEHVLAKRIRISDVRSMFVAYSIHVLLAAWSVFGNAGAQVCADVLTAKRSEAYSASP